MTGIVINIIYSDFIISVIRLSVKCPVFTGILKDKSMNYNLIYTLHVLKDYVWKSLDTLIFEPTNQDLIKAPTQCSKVIEWENFLLLNFGYFFPIILEIKIKIYSLYKYSRHIKIKYYIGIKPKVAKLKKSYLILQNIEKNASS